MLFSSFDRTAPSSFDRTTTDPSQPVSKLGYCSARTRRHLPAKTGPQLAACRGVSAIVYTVDRKSGGYVKAGVVPANHSEEAHFGLADSIIVGFLLACAGGLVCLLLLA